MKLIDEQLIKAQEQITVADLAAVANALDMWLDAFSDDDSFEKEEIDSVKKIAAKIDRVIASASQASKAPPPKDVQ